jgi:uncharacterized membrane protein
MTSKIKKYVFSRISDLYRSIAFLPTLISVFFIVAAIVVLQIESSESLISVVKFLPIVEPREINKFVEILTTLLTGIISLTIFSFSMVMIVLNQAAATYTPKVLSIIVEQRSNQFVLGFYIGTILFYIIVLIYISDAEINQVSRWLSFYLSVIFAISSILLFVHFIHNVSVSIQVKNIIHKIFSLTRKKIQQDERKTIELDKNKINKEFKFTYKSMEGGYLQSYLSDFPKFLKEKDLVLRMDAKFGEYLLKGNNLFSVDKEIDTKTREEIQQYLIFSPNEDISEHSIYGFYQIMEIAIKALSPGINNTGIALICIDYLTDLFALKADNLKSNCVYDKDNNIRLIAGEISIHEVFFTCFTQIREYGRNSTAVAERLLQSFQKLAANDLERNLFRKVLTEQAESIIISSDQVFITPSERNHLNKVIQSLNNYPENYFNLPLLKKK